MLYYYYAEVVRVVDGDTYDLRVDLGFRHSFQDRFRLKGADTPEVYGVNASEKGKEVSAYVDRLLRAQKVPFLIQTFKDDRGKYGRWLVDIELTRGSDGKLWISTEWLSQHLINTGRAEEVSY